MSLMKMATFYTMCALSVTQVDAAEWNFSYGMEVGAQYRGKPIAEYDTSRILIAGVDAGDGAIPGNAESAINTCYEKYMCGIETRVIKNRADDYVYIHEATGANSRFVELISAVTNGLASNSTFVKRLLETWGSVDQQKFKYLPDVSTLYIPSQSIAALFQSIYKVMESVAIYRDRTTCKLPPYVGFMDFDSNWSVFCNQTFTITPDGLTPVPDDQIVVKYLKEKVQPRNMLTIGNSENLEERSLNDCVEIAKQRMLPNGLNLDRVLLATTHLSGEPKTAYEQWLDTFERCVNFGEDRLFLSSEIESKFGAIAEIMTSSDGIRQGLLSLVRDHIAAGKPISKADQTYYELNVLTGIMRLFSLINTDLNDLLTGLRNGLAEKILNNVQINSRGEILIPEQLFRFSRTLVKTPVLQRKNIGGPGWDDEIDV